MRNTFSTVGEVMVKNRTVKASDTYSRGFVYLPRRAATAAHDFEVFGLKFSTVRRRCMLVFGVAALSRAHPG